MKKYGIFHIPSQKRSANYPDKYDTWEEADKVVGGLMKNSAQRSLHRSAYYVDEVKEEMTTQEANTLMNQFCVDEQREKARKAKLEADLVQLQVEYYQTAVKKLAELDRQIPTTTFVKPFSS